MESDTPTELSSHECHIAGHTNITAIEFTNEVVCLSGVTPESVAVYHCRNWYELYFPHGGHNPRTCGSDGQWNGSLPYCSKFAWLSSCVGLPMFAVVKFVVV